MENYAILVGIVRLDRGHDACGKQGKKTAAVRNLEGLLVGKPKNGCARSMPTKVIMKKKIKEKPLNSKTASAVHLSVRGDIDRLKSADQFDAYIAGFARAWSYFTNKKAGVKVFQYLNNAW